MKKNTSIQKLKVCLIIQSALHGLFNAMQEVFTYFAEVHNFDWYDFLVFPTQKIDKVLSPL